MSGEKDDLDKAHAISIPFEGMDMTIASFRDAGDQVHVLGRPFRKQLVSQEDFLVARTYQWIGVGKYDLAKEDKFGIYPRSLTEMLLPYFTLGLNLLRPDVRRRRKEVNMFWERMSDEKAAGADINLTNYLDLLWGTYGTQ